MTITQLHQKPRTHRLKRYFTARERLPLAAMVVRAVGRDWNEATHRPYMESVIDWAIEARINAKYLEWALQGHLDVRAGPDGNLTFVHH